MLHMLKSLILCDNTAPKCWLPYFVKMTISDLASIAIIYSKQAHETSDNYQKGN